MCYLTKTLLVMCPASHVPGYYDAQRGMAELTRGHLIESKAWVGRLPLICFIFG